MISTNPYSDRNTFFQLVSEHKDLEIQVNKLKQNSFRTAAYAYIRSTDNCQSIFDLDKDFSWTIYSGMENYAIRNKPALDAIKNFVLKILENDRECFIKFKSSELWGDKDSIIEVAQLSEKLVCHTDFSKVELDCDFLSKIEKISYLSFYDICFCNMLYDKSTNNIKELLFRATKINPQFLIDMETYLFGDKNSLFRDKNLNFTNFVTAELLPSFTLDERSCLYDRVNQMKTAGKLMVQPTENGGFLLASKRLSEIVAAIKVFETTLSNKILSYKMSKNLCDIRFKNL